MWLRCAVLFAIASAALAAPDLRNEDLRSVQEAFNRNDAALKRFSARDKKPIDGARSVMIVTARDLIKSGVREIGLFVVSGRTNHVELMLDVFPESDTQGFPELDHPLPTSVNLHFYGDYGRYGGSIKYFYNLAGETSPAKFPYTMQAFTSSAVRNGKLLYRGRESQLTIEPAIGGAAPKYTLTRLPAPAIEPVREPASFRLADGRLVRVRNTRPGETHQIAGFSMPGSFYPVPVPTKALYRKLRPPYMPNEIENNIGPAALDGSTIWFANSFYDGEGVSGVGAVGSFDTRTHKFEMRYLPEIAGWSGSALRLDGDDLWIGLMLQPEGSAYGGGLLRYNVKTGAVATFKIADYIYTIDRLGDAVYCGTSNGVYAVRGSEVKQMRFEPNAAGKVVMVYSNFLPAI